MERVYIKNLRSMKTFAKKFAKTLSGGQIVLLRGDLGAGKTTFCQFVAKTLKIDEPITSPTFTLLKDYEGRVLNMSHFDLYRITNASEVQEFGFDDYIFNTPKDRVVFVEWPDNVGEDYYQGVKTTNITIEKVDDNARYVTLEEK